MDPTTRVRLRVGLSEDLSYELGFDDNYEPRQDILGQSQGISIVVDRQSAQQIPAGTIIDFHSGGGNRGFVFSAPKSGQIVLDVSVSLVEARRGFRTQLARRSSAESPAPQPPARILQTVWYDSDVGKLVAYLTPDPRDGRKHPAIIWITGGDCNTIGDGCWTEGPSSNEQSASAYRKSGIVMMFPSQRGGNSNPGLKEGFLGEVNDVLAAAEFLSKQPYVDPKRIYLGGHSSGGTLVLLVSEFTDRFRAVFSFGPTDDIRGYPPALRPFAIADSKEHELRSPGRWLHSIRSPTFVLEGVDARGADAVLNMQETNKNSKVIFFAVQRADHFNVLAPVNRLIATKILQDVGESCNLTISQTEIAKLFRR